MAHAGYPKHDFHPGPITLADLPPHDTVRWVSSRKAAVVAAVQAGVITLADACRRYALSVEEFLAWEDAFKQQGQPGLRVSATPQTRKKASH